MEEEGGGTQGRNGGASLAIKQMDCVSGMDDGGS